MKTIKDTIYKKLPPKCDLLVLEFIVGTIRYELDTTHPEWRNYTSKVKLSTNVEDGIMVEYTRYEDTSNKSTA